VKTHSYLNYGGCRFSRQRRLEAQPTLKGNLWGFQPQRGRRSRRALGAWDGE